MGSLGSLKNKVSSSLTFAKRYKLSPGLVFELMKTRDKVLRQQLDALGIRSDDTDDQAVIARRMKLGGVTITTVKRSDDDPRENFLVLSKNDTPVVAISEPFIEAGKIHVRVIEPDRLHMGIA